MPLVLYAVMYFFYFIVSSLSYFFFAPTSYLGPPRRKTAEEEERVRHPRPEVCICMKMLNRTLISCPCITRLWIQDSVYYHPTLNPTGAPPPGKPPMFKSSIGSFLLSSVFSRYSSFLLLSDSL